MNNVGSDLALEVVRGAMAVPPTLMLTPFAKMPELDPEGLSAHRGAERVGSHSLALGRKGWATTTKKNNPQKKLCYPPQILQKKSGIPELMRLKAAPPGHTIQLPFQFKKKPFNLTHKAAELRGGERERCLGFGGWKKERERNPCCHSAAIETLRKGPLSVWWGDPLRADGLRPPGSALQNIQGCV